MRYFMIILKQNSVSIEIYITFKLILRFISLIHQLIPWNLNQAHEPKSIVFWRYMHIGEFWPPANEDLPPAEWVWPPSPRMSENAEKFAIFNDCLGIFLIQLTSSLQKFLPDTNLFDYT